MRVVLFAAAAAVAGCGASGDSGPLETESTTSGTAAASSSSASSAGGGTGAAQCASDLDGDTLRLAVGASVAPGDETTLCLRWTAPEALDITAFSGELGPGGHHTLLMSYAEPKEPDGVGPCSE